MKEYPENIVLTFNHDYETQNWILEESKSTKDKLQFYGYDANLYPLIDLSKTSEENQKDVIEKVKKLFKKDNIEIWLDDVKIKAKKGTLTIVFKARLNEDKQIELDSDFAKKLDEVYQNSRAIGTLQFLEELEKTKVLIEVIGG
jgi:hypothetical protein|nr:MAG TPA: hypothetical protein [Caudoviricetes sp.]